MEIGKVAVLGAGVMGAGIAAHVANAGVPVLLLDIVPEGANDRSAIAAGAGPRLTSSRSTTASTIQSQPASLSRSSSRLPTVEPWR